MWLLSDNNPAGRALTALYRRFEWALNATDAYFTGKSGRPKTPPILAFLGTVVLAGGVVLLFGLGVLWELANWWRTITPRKLVYGYMMLATLLLAATALDLVRGGNREEPEFMEEG